MKSLFKFLPIFLDFFIIELVRIICFMNVFSQSLAYLFIFLMVSFDEQKIFVVFF